MTTVTAFNDMMDQFLNELVLTFPEEKTLLKYQATFGVAKMTWPRATLEGFMKSIGPHAEKIMAKDEKFFLENGGDMEWISEVNLQNIWKPEISESTKAAIWQYLQTLYMLGTTIMMFPPETLAAIEGVAAKCAENAQAGGAINEKALMSGMNSLLAQMMGGGGGAGSLANLLGGPQAPPGPSKKKKSRK
jgi:hypothetical protein